MIIVYAPGVWDLLHVGHVSALKMAKGLGDRLVVGVAADSVVQEDKGRLPVIKDSDRRQMVESLRVVALAIVYRALTFLPQLNMFQPDVMAVPEDWGTADRHRSAEDWLRSHGRRLFKLPYYQGESTTQIVNRVRLRDGG